MNAAELDLVGQAVSRLRERIDLSQLPTVEAGLQLGDTTPPAIPAVVVFVAGDDATESNAPEAGVLQRVTATLAVAHVIPARNTKRNAGGPAVDPMAQLTGLTRAQLNGWRPPGPPGRRDSLAFRRGRLTAIADGRAVWQDEYTISWRVAATQED